MTRFVIPDGGKLFGRDAESSALRAALKSNHVIVVTGPPGIGKSALVHGLADAVFCALAGAHGADDALRVVARAFSVPVAAGAADQEIAARVGRAIAGRGRPVVVLDDVDRCRDAIARALKRWTVDAPNARFVITARTRTGLGGARIDVGPLDASAGAKLFAARAEMRLDVDEAEHVRAIVDALEGVPLAIELAAARAAVLAPAEIERLLAAQLDLLDSGERSLRSAFALSWDELDEEEAAALAVLATFRGGFDVGAANAVIGRADNARDRIRTARVLEKLAERSLLRARDDRHVLTEALRAYALEQLEDRGEADDARRRHARWFASLELSAVEDLERERLNLDDALAFAMAKNDAKLAASVLHVLGRLVLARGPLAPFVENVGWVAKRLPAKDRHELLLQRGLAEIFRGRRDDALGDLKVARRSKDARVRALAASKTGLVLAFKGETRGAEAAFADAFAAAKKAGDPLTRGIVTKDRANVLAERGESEEAMGLLARARTLLHAAGDLREEGFVAMMMGMRLFDEGRLDDARRDLSAALGVLRRAGDRRSEAWTLAMLGLVAAESGDFSDARTRLEASLAIVRTVGDEHTEGLVTSFLGHVALEQGVLRDAEQSYAHATMLLERAGDRAAEAFVIGTAAAVDHELGRMGAAKDGLRRARTRLANDGRSARRDAVAVLATMLDGDEAMRRVAREKGSDPEEVRFARRVIARRLGPRVRADDVAAPITVAEDGSWVRVGSGAAVRLGRARALANIVRELAMMRVRHPGRAIAGPVLVRAGWPDERILPKAAKNRLHVSIARLRKLGLEGAIVSDLDGYFLDPKVAVSDD